jgi:hypothetical protein
MNEWLVLLGLAEKWISRSITACRDLHSDTPFLAWASMLA